MNFRAFLFVTPIWIFFLIAGVIGVITNEPSNAVAEVGGQAIFNCTSDTTLQNWIFAKSRDDLGTLSAQNIAINCVIQAGFTAHYEVDRPIGSTNTCNLIVKATTMQQAGIYTCSDTVYGPSAILTVIETTPNVTYNNTKNVIVENDNVIITCTLSYSGSVSPAPTLRPYFHWTNISGHQINSSYDSTTENQAVSKISVTAGRQNITPYACHVYLQLNSSTNPSYANNTPTVNKSSASPTIEVLFSPSIPQITVRTVSEFANGVQCKVNVLACISTGNPSPKYNWFDANRSLSDVISEEQNVSYADANHNYICEAYNSIRNVMHTSSANYIVVVPDAFYNKSYCYTQVSNGSASVAISTLVLAVVLGGYGLCNVIAMIAFLAFYNRKSNSAEDDNVAPTFRNREKVNEICPLIQRMLPCMNDSKEDTGCTFLWLLLFVLISILSGVITFPILMLLVNYSKKNTDLQGKRINFSASSVQTDNMANRENENSNAVTYEGLHPMVNRDQPEVYTILNSFRNETETTIS